jgi:hypothetical protein
VVKKEYDTDATPFGEVLLLPGMRQSTVCGKQCEEQAL